MSAKGTAFENAVEADMLARGWVAKRLASTSGGDAGDVWAASRLDVEPRPPRRVDRGGMLTPDQATSRRGDALAAVHRHATALAVSQGMAHMDRQARNRAIREAPKAGALRAEVAQAADLSTTAVRLILRGVR